MPITLNGKYYTFQEAAIEFGVSVPRMRQYVANGRLEIIRVSPRSTLVLASELDRLKARRAERRRYPPD